MNVTEQQLMIMEGLQAKHPKLVFWVEEMARAGVTVTADDFYAGHVMCSVAIHTDDGHRPHEYRWSRSVALESIDRFDSTFTQYIIRDIYTGAQAHALESMQFRNNLNQKVKDLTK